MNRTIKLIIFILIFIAIFQITVMLINKKQRNANITLTQKANEKPHPLFIEEIQKKEFPKQQLIIESEVNQSNRTFKSYILKYLSDGLQQYALLNIPTKKMPENGYPVVIINHGYIRPEAYSTTKDYKYVSAFFASKGFLVIKPDYRGHQLSEQHDDSIINRLSYPLDVLSLLHNIGTLQEANDDLIFMYGHSMGGGITMTVLECTDKVKAATLWAPVSIAFPESIFFYIRRRNPAEVKLHLKEYLTFFKKEEFFKLSPINYTDDITAPLIIHHGTDDDAVPYEWSLELTDTLSYNHTRYQFYYYKGEDHNFARGSFYKVLQRDVDFFKRFIE